LLSGVIRSGDTRSRYFKGTNECDIPGGAKADALYIEVTHAFSTEETAKTKLVGGIEVPVGSGKATLGGEVEVAPSKQGSRAIFLIKICPCGAGGNPIATLSKQPDNSMTWTYHRIASPSWSISVTSE
jgi:hypothetical protein